MPMRRNPHIAVGDIVAGAREVLDIKRSYFSPASKRFGQPPPPGRGVNGLVTFYFLRCVECDHRAWSASPDKMCRPCSFRHVHTTRKPASRRKLPVLPDGVVLLMVDGEGDRRSDCTRYADCLAVAAKYLARREDRMCHCPEGCGQYDPMTHEEKLAEATTRYESQFSLTSI